MRLKLAGAARLIVSFRTWQHPALLLAVGGLARCTSSSGPNLAPCSGAVTLTPSSGLTPTLVWTPNCLVDQVTVEENIAPSAGGPQPRWIIQSQTTGQGTPSPLRYGDVPAPMQVVLSAAALVAGHQYRVHVSGGGTVVGTAVFTP
jgi:hypothetical protein